MRVTGSRLQKLVLAASVAAGGLSLSWSPAAGAADAPGREAAQPQERDRVSDAAAKPAAGEAAKPLALPPGVEQKDLEEAGDIRNAFEAVTEAALDDDDAFDNIVNRLVDADRDRVAKFKEQDPKPDFKPLHDRIATLNRHWKNKYGKEFDLDEKVVFGEAGYVAIAQGEIADPAQLVGKWPVAPLAAGEARLAAEKEPGKQDKEGAPADTAQQVREAGKAAGGDVNLNKGRDVAVARFPAGHAMPALDLSLIHENPDVWRFDIPDNIDGRKLHDNLVKHLNLLGDGSNWPDDPKDAYRMVAHHVLLALYDVDLPRQKDAKGADGTDVRD